MTLQVALFRRTNEFTANIRKRRQIAGVKLGERKKMKIYRFFCRPALAITGLALLLFSALFLAQKNHVTLTPNLKGPEAGLKSTARLAQSFNAPAMLFEKNLGQADERIAYISRQRGYTLYLKPDETILSFLQKNFRRDSVASRSERQGESTIGDLSIRLIGANPKPEMEGLEALSHHANYFIGSDAGKWIKNVLSYRSVRYQDIYPGIDMICYSHQSEVEFDFVLAPGADPNAIALDFSSADHLQLDNEGQLHISIGAESLTLKAPSIYQKKAGEMLPVSGHYVFKDQHQIGFQIATFDPSLALVIDPVLVYSTYLGGSLDEAVLDIDVDDIGNFYVMGGTRSVDFPTVSPLQGDQPNTDVFVSKFDTAGALIFSTYLGGNGFEAFDGGIAVDATGNIYLTGATRSTNFPTKNAFQPQIAPPQSGSQFSDAFITKIAASGADLVFSTYFGGDFTETAGEIAIDNAGIVYVTGSTLSPNFPTRNPIQAARAGGSSDLYIAKFNTLGALMYSTYFGGSGSVEESKGIAVDVSGNMLIAGYTDSKDFPLKNAVRNTFVGLRDPFVVKLNSPGNALIYSTYLGGGDLNDRASAIAVDAEGSAYVTGSTWSQDFAITRGVLQETLRGVSDAFITKLSSAGALVYSTYLGASATEGADDIAVDAQGAAFVIGITASADFPTVKPIQSHNASASDDAFIVRLNSAGTALLFSSYLGGRGSERGSTEDAALAIDKSGNIYAAGTTSSDDFPLSDKPFQNKRAGGYDAFVVKIGERGSSIAIQAKPVRNEIRLGGDLTAIKVNVIDPQTGKVAEDFDGNAVYRILDNISTPLIGRRLTATLSRIEKGVAQDVFFEATRERFDANMPITEKTVLSGVAFVEVRVENSALPPDTVRIALKSPLDFFVERLELQQGVVDIDKEVTLEYKPGANKTFPALPLVAEHHTVLLAHVDYNVKEPIAFSKIEGIAGVYAKVHVSRNGTSLGTFESFRFPLPNFILKDPKNYDSLERASLQDVVAALIPHDVIKTPADNYKFDVELAFELGLDELAADKMNNTSSMDAPFVATKPLRVLARVGKNSAEDNVPKVDGKIWDYLRSAFPLQWSNLHVTNPNLVLYEDSNPSLDKFEQILARYNKENLDDQRQRIVIFTASEEMISQVCGRNAGGCANINGKALIVKTVKPEDANQTLAHEFGHTFGLNDTYKVSEYATLDGEPNPRRVLNDDVGNLVEDGNIRLADFETAWKIGLARAINDKGTSFYEFMGKPAPSSWVDRVTWDYLYRTHFRAGQSNNRLATNSAESFITVSGLVDTNGVVSFNPFVVSPKVPEISTARTGAFALDFTEASGTSLQRFSFNIIFHVPEVGNVARVPFSFDLPLPERTVKIAFMKNSVALASRTFSQNAPIVAITSPASGQLLGEATTIAWTASDPDGDKLVYDILYSPNGQEQNVIALGLTEKSYLLKSALVPKSAAATLTVIANDGINEGRATLRNLIVAVGQKEMSASPANFILHPNYPNPLRASAFSPVTTIRFELPESSYLEIAIYNVNGKLVKTLLSRTMQPGEHAVAWDGRNEEGQLVSSGVYIYRIRSGDYAKSRKLVLLR